MKNQEMVAMILAGGRGTRLLDLTTKNAKPAVYYGGKYRIIDFPLSNCSNSNIGVVGVLTQYESVLLHYYTADGGRWGLDAKDSGVYILPPRETADKQLGVYRGTADAITQNIDFIDSYNPEYVLILSGDHIYKMQYDKMLEYHKEKKADCTIAVLDVSLDEAKRFGIMNCNEDMSIYEFEEKPAKPKSTLASMGIYIFSWPVLKEYLLADEKVDSAHDFGKNIIPNLLADDKRMFAWRFKGYWKDVGTIDSLWEANMDLLDPNSGLNLDDPKWKIYSEDSTSTPQYIAESATLENCYVNQGVELYGTAKNSVLYTDVIIEEGATVIDSVLLPNVVVKSGAYLNRVIVQEDVVIEGNVREDGHEGIKLIAKKEEE